MLLQALCIVSLPLVNSNWSYSPEMPNLGQIRRFLEQCELEIWRMTLKNNRAPLLWYFKLCASFHSHWWIQSNWSYSPETPNPGQIRQILEPCDLEIWQMNLKNNRAPLLSNIKLYASWPWPFAWTSLLSLIITPENFMMIRWWEHSEKGVTDRQTDRRTENTIHRAAWSQLKIGKCMSISKYLHDLIIRN